MSGRSRLAKLAILQQQHRKLLRNVLIGATSAAGIYAVATRTDLGELSTAPRRLREHFDVYFDRIHVTGQTCRTLLASVVKHSPSAGLTQKGGLTLLAMQALADSTASHDEREVVVLVGGSLMLDWLLYHAVHAPANSNLQRAAMQAIVNLLGDAGTASALLGRPTAVPRLLELLNHSWGPDRVPVEGAQDLQEALSNALPSASFPLVVQLDDVQDTLHLVGSKASSSVRRLAVSVLAFWASTSVVNSGKVAMCEGGRVLTELARGMAAESRPDRKLQVAVVRCMSILARTCPVPASLHLNDWLPELMYLAADAAARRDVRLASYALYATAACLATGVDLQAAVLASNAFPLLRSLVQQLPQQSKSMDTDMLREAVATLVGAAAGAGPLPPEEVQYWTDTLLHWLTDSATQEGLRLAAAQALAGLSTPATLSGLSVAVEWLGTLLVHLSMEATPYTAFKVLDHQEEAGDTGGVIQGPSTGPPPLKSAVPILPTWARAIAADLVAETDKQTGVYSEPPALGEIVPSPQQARAARGQVADAPLDDGLLCKALQALADLVSNDTSKQRWLYSAGVFPLVQRLLHTGFLTPKHRDDNPDEPSDSRSIDALMQERSDRCPLIQTARLLAMLSADPSVAAAMRRTVWRGWLQEGQNSLDCRVQSYCTAALLHMEAAEAASKAQGIFELDLLPKDRKSSAVPGSPLDSLEQSLETLEVFLEEVATQLAQSARDALKPTQEGANERPNEGPQAQGMAEEEPREKSSQAEGSHPAQHPAVLSALQRRLTLRDGVHLLDPSAPHHHALALHGVDDSSAASPAMDVVFVHGIRGGPFATWRRDDAGTSVVESDPTLFPREKCWPSAWLSADLPNCRLLAVEYPAAASGWEGESLPMRDTAAVMMEKLLDAGVGTRPVVFVCHSMGGLLVKELLLRSTSSSAPKQESALADALKGVVFYSTPHHGTWLADWGWKLRFFGASPAAALAHVRPGKHLEVLNNKLRTLYDSGQVKVLSFAEGDASSFGSLLPPIMVVPQASANPGFGEFHVLPGINHINVCKPTDRQDISYSDTLKFLRHCLDDAQGAQLVQENSDVALQAAAHLQVAIPQLQPQLQLQTAAQPVAPVPACTPAGNAVASAKVPASTFPAVVSLQSRH